MTRTFNDETLMRFVDGELEPQGVAEIEAAQTHDPVLAARVQALKQVRDLSRHAFPIAADPRDQVLRQMIAESAKPASLGQRLQSLLADAFAPRPAGVWAGLAAAAFVGGLVLSPLLGGQATRGNLVIGAGGTIHDPGLTRVLDERLAAEGTDPSGRAVGLTFRNDAGQWCRTFSAAEAGVAGLACRRGNAWSVQALAPFDAPSTEFRTAASETPDLILRAVDATQASDTLDSRAERQARDSGWR